ncbi:hypothetical protein KKB99_01505, partial [bacterium]|nr:hypothetical protein [bacterium]MBU1024662.1 hypothetical protein [bacterium]
MAVVRNNLFKLISSDSGFTLLEVAFAGAIMVIVGLAYLGTISQSISISKLYTDQNQANILIEHEMEVLRNTNFELIPFKQTSDAEKLEEVPDYYENIAIADDDPIQPGFAGSSGDQAGSEFIFAFDGFRAGENGWSRWLAVENGPLSVPGGGFIPQTDEPVIIGNPDDPTDPIIINPKDYEIPRDLSEDSQFVYIAFPKKQKIHRIVYDNRFNVRGNDTLLDTEIDYRNHRDNIWQRDYQIFITDDDEITPGLPFRPEHNSSEVIHEETGLGYGSAGLIEVFNNIVEPIYATVLGVANISVETDFDPTYHYPYVSELEAYGFKFATSYTSSYQFPDGDIHVGNYVIFMPNYQDTDFDMFRRVYIEKSDAEFPPTLHEQPFFRIQIKIYPHDESRNTDEFVKEFWWQKDDREIMTFTMTLANDWSPAVDNLPGLQDLPRHTYYYNDEDIAIDYTVPGAEKIRAHFDTFELQGYPDTDYIQFYDINDTQFGSIQYYSTAAVALDAGFGPWVDGDTLR